ncbi:MAG: hypothetical protein ACXV8R_07890 [Acidimicrobiia bacterium]
MVSSVALTFFAFLGFGVVTAAHFRVRHETGARLPLLVLAIASTVTVLATFALTTLVEEPATAVTIVAILLLAVLLDFSWKARRPEGTPPAAQSHA